MTHNVDDLLSKLTRFNPVDPDAGWKACDELMKLENLKNNDEIGTKLIQSLKSNNDAATRAHIVEIMGKIGSPNIISALRDIGLKDPYRLTKAYAARQLGELQDESSLRELINLLLDDDEYFGVRAEAAEALGKICKGKKSEICTDVRDALKEAPEKLRNIAEPRKKRTIAEAQQALLEIDKILGQVEDEISNEIDSQEKELDDAEKSGDSRKAEAVKKTIKILKMHKGSIYNIRSKLADYGTNFMVPDGIMP